MYAGLTGISFLVLFGVIFWSTARFMRHQIDDSVISEINEIRSGARGMDPKQLQVFMQDLIRHSQGFVYLLQDPDGSAIAGNLAAMTPVTGIREWHAGQDMAPHPDIRGMGARLGDDYLFVGWSTHQLHEMEQFVVGAFLCGLAASVVLALAGGLLMSGRLLRRVRTISETGRQIVAGDLGQRLPVSTRGDEFDNLGVSINAMLDRIESLMGDLRQVTTDIAHDMRTPLTRLRQAMELGQHSAASLESTREVLGKAIAQIDAILGIFAALLRIAQIESGTGALRTAPVDLSTVVSRAAELYQGTAEEKHQRVSQRYELGPVTQGDSELLLQLFANLIENAVVHCPVGATITLTTARAGHEVRVVVADSGPGIAAALRGKVLQRFFRLESSRTTPGNGLGLSLVAAIAKLHRARLELADNSPGLRVAVIFRASS
jgi:signal transduction histidine kinase